MTFSSAATRSDSLRISASRRRSRFVESVVVLVFASNEAHFADRKSAPCPSYRLPLSLPKRERRKRLLMDSTFAYVPRSVPLTRTCAKLQRGAATPARANNRYAVHCRMREAS